VTAPADPTAWDAFVESSDPGSYLQLTAWARVKAVNGWSAHRLRAGAHHGPGAQILVRRPRPLPWGFAYAPRGPIAESWSPEEIGAFTDLVRTELPGAAGRVSHLRIDPEIELDGSRDTDGAVRRALQEAGWRPAPPIQPASTRIIDLRLDEEALWGDLRKKWRQYVNKARSGGVTVREVDAAAEPAAFPTFHRVMRETSLRTGIPLRTEAVYRELWTAFRATDESRLLFAERLGEVEAVLLLVACGGRVVEPYGGMTAPGAESRANYLLKWEAIRTSREQGARSYDLWGLVHPGISHFKEGFGGRPVRYVGAWDLLVSPVGGRVFRAAEWGRRTARSSVRRVRGRSIGAAVTETPDA
jgi:lipid II:glycine glycyltransferase (peptidoglycan interpeptide bridge formation enzyme)